MQTYPQRGFSLIEVLVVLAIVSIALTAVSLSVTRPSGKAASLEMQRLERVIQLVTERSVLLGREHRLVFDATGYGIEERFQGHWRAVSVAPYQTRRWPEFIQLTAARFELAISAAGIVNEQEFVLRVNGFDQTVRINALGALHQAS